SDNVPRDGGQNLQRIVQPKNPSRIQGGRGAGGQGRIGWRWLLTQPPGAAGIAGARHGPRRSRRRSSFRRGWARPRGGGAWQSVRHASARRRWGPGRAFLPAPRAERRRPGTRRRQRARRRSAALPRPTAAPESRATPGLPWPWTMPTRAGRRDAPGFPPESGWSRKYGIPQSPGARRAAPFPPDTPASQRYGGATGDRRRTPSPRWRSSGRLSAAGPRVLPLPADGVHPRPMNGILVAITVRNWTFVSSGRLAM